MTDTNTPMLLITQVKSGITQTPAARKTLRALGLTKIGSTVQQADIPTTRGMIRAVRHLVTVEVAPEKPKEAPKAVKEAPKEAPKAAVKAAPKDTPKDAPKAAEKAPKAAPKAAAKEVK